MRRLVTPREMTYTEAESRAVSLLQLLEDEGGGKKTLYERFLEEYEDLPDELKRKLDEYMMARKV